MNLLKQFAICEKKKNRKGISVVNKIRRTLDLLFIDPCNVDPSNVTCLFKKKRVEIETTRNIYIFAKVKTHEN